MPTYDIWMCLQISVEHDDKPMDLVGPREMGVAAAWSPCQDSSIHRQEGTVFTGSMCGVTSSAAAPLMER
jgi:hypothetical protein